MEKVITDEMINRAIENNDPYKMTSIAYDLIFKSTLYKKENPFKPYQAIQLLQKAAKDNYAGAYFYLGYLFENGIILYNSIDNAILFYKKASQLKNVNAIEALKRLEIVSFDFNLEELEFILNNLLLDEYNSIWVNEVTKVNSFKEEKQFKEQEVITKNESSKTNLMKNNDEEKELEKKRIEEENRKQVKFLVEDADTDDTCCFKLGRAYFYGIFGLYKNEEKAFELFNKAMEFGNIEAKVFLAECYFLGKGTTKDPKKGYKILKEACKTRPLYFNAYYYMALNYNKGLYKKDLRKALKYLTIAYSLIDEKSGKNACGDLCNMLGYYYFNGIETKQDYNRAFEFYKESFEKFNYSPALINLHVCYYNGYGVNKDLHKAKEYLLEASNRKDLRGDAREFVNNLMKKYF